MTTPVSFELAKLLKENGFDLYCQHSYWKGELTLHTPGYALKDGTTSQANYFNFERYYAPTIAEVVMWLYEKHGIWISVVPYDDEELSQTLWENKIIDIADDYNDYSDYTFYHSPTEAYEAVILYTLNNLI